MLVNKPGALRANLPRRGECGAVFSQARDGHWFCIRKAHMVTCDDCEGCDERPRSMYLKGGMR